MPDPDLQKYIFDVLEAINNLESFTAEITLDKLEKKNSNGLWKEASQSLEKHCIKPIKLKKI